MRPPGARPGRRSANPQGRKLAAAMSSVATTAPRVSAAYAALCTRGELRTSTAHLLFGSPATCMRPVALRPRLATGLPLSIGRDLGRR
jgi:hypothetical protein